jgi:hypothetical protein
MKMDRRTRQFAQIGVYGVLLIVLALVARSSPLGQRLIGGEFTSVETPVPVVPDNSARRRSSPDADDERRISSLDREHSSPAYQNARDSLFRLDEARSRLLNAGAQNGSQDLEAVGEEYRDALNGFRDALAQLEARVEPGVYGGLFHRLLMDRAAHQGRTSPFLFPEWKLTRLQRGMPR